MRLTRFRIPLVLTAAMIVLLMPAWAGNSYRVLYSFDGSYGVGGPNGGPPLASPLPDGKGNLYGPAGGGTGEGCDGPCGVIYKMTRGSDGHWHESVALNVSDHYQNGWPDSVLALDRHGNLYGSLNSAWVFRMSPQSGGWGFDLIYQGYGTDPGGVLPDARGNLYGALGTPSDYRSTIGQLSPDSGGWTYDNLYNFCGDGNCDDGANPRAPLIWDDHGSLYGTTYWGGYGGHACSDGNGCGVVFQLSPNGDGGWSYNVMHRFGGPGAQPDGQNPWSGVVNDRSGNFYGTTFYGGAHGHGAIFKLTRNGREWRETSLYSFPNTKLGAYPWGNLVFDKSGNLYGVANGGESCSHYFCGQVFKLTPQADGRWRYSVIHAFKGPDGAYPYGIVIDEEGHLFGTALGGGANGYGVVFEIIP